MTSADPQRDAATTVAWLIVVNKPFYPLYVWCLGGSALAACATLAAMPAFAALAWAGRRNSRAIRLGLPLVGLADTLFATKVFGPASGTELFCFPCLLLAILGARADEPHAARGLVATIFVAFVAAHGHYGAPLYAWPPDALARVFELNVYSVASLSAFVCLRFAGVARSPPAGPGVVSE